MYMKRHSFDMSAVARLKLCNVAKKNRNWMPGTPGLLWKPSYSRKEDRRDVDMLSRPNYSSFSTCLVAHGPWNGCRLAGCVVFKRIELSANFISERVRGLAHGHFWLATTVAGYLTKVVLTAIQCLTAVTCFASGILPQYAIKTDQQNRVCSVLWPVWKGVLSMGWRAVSWSDMSSRMKDVFDVLRLQWLKSVKAASERTLSELLNQ